MTDSAAAPESKARRERSARKTDKEEDKSSKNELRVLLCAKAADSDAALSALDRLHIPACTCAALTPDAVKDYAQKHVQLLRPEFALVVAYRVPVSSDVAAAAAACGVRVLSLNGDEALVPCAAVTKKTDRARASKLAKAGDSVSHKWTKSRPAAAGETKADSSASTSPAERKFASEHDRMAMLVWNDIIGFPADKSRKQQWVHWMPIAPGSSSRFGLWHRPMQADLKRAAAEGCTLVVSLLSGKEQPDTVGKPAKALGMNWIRVPLDGANIPLLSHKDTHNVVRSKLTEVSKIAASSPSNVLIHCAAGIHRTGVFGYSLLRLAGATPEQAHMRLCITRAITASGVAAERLEIAETLLLPALLQNAAAAGGEQKSAATRTSVAPAAEASTSTGGVAEVGQASADSAQASASDDAARTS